MNDKAITVDDYLNDKDPYVCTTWSYIAKWLLQMYQIGKKTKNMKACDLMIGDWVKAPQGPRIVTIIGAGKVGLLHCGFTNFYYIDEIEPIPLTPEILEKNGFGYYSIGGAEQWLIKDDYYDIKVYEWSDSIWVFKYDSTEMNTPHTQITLCYTHELQHALRLCGIDNEIEL